MRLQHSACIYFIFQMSLGGLGADMGGIASLVGSIKAMQAFKKLKPIPGVSLHVDNVDHIQNH